MNDYGAELKYQRIKRNLTIEKVSKDTGITISNLSRWENNKVLPNIDFCVKLAEYYDITLDELVGRDR